MIGYAKFCIHGQHFEGIKACKQNVYVKAYQETKMESYKNSCQIQSSVKFVGHHLRGGV
jgi:hypothetical protein